jgi:hypothetical protein
LGKYKRLQELPATLGQDGENMGGDFYSLFHGFLQKPSDSSKKPGTHIGVDFANSPELRINYQRSRNADKYLL